MQKEENYKRILNMKSCFSLYCFEKYFNEETQFHNKIKQYKFNWVFDILYNNFNVKYFIDDLKDKWKFKLSISLNYNDKDNFILWMKDFFNTKMYEQIFSRFEKLSEMFNTSYNWYFLIDNIKFLVFEIQFISYFKKLKESDKKEFVIDFYSLISFVCAFHVEYYNFLLKWLKLNKNDIIMKDEMFLFSNYFYKTFRKYLWKFNDEYIHWKAKQYTLEKQWWLFYVDDEMDENLYNRFEWFHFETYSWDLWINSLLREYQENWFWVFFDKKFFENWINICMKNNFTWLDNIWDNFDKLYTINRLFPIYEINSKLFKHFIFWRNIHKETKWMYEIVENYHKNSLKYMKRLNKKDINELFWRVLRNFHFDKLNQITKYFSNFNDVYDILNKNELKYDEYTLIYKLIEIVYNSKTSDWKERTIVLNALIHLYNFHCILNKINEYKQYLNKNNLKLYKELLNIKTFFNTQLIDVIETYILSIERAFYILKKRNLLNKKDFNELYTITEYKQFLNYHLNTLKKLFEQETILKNSIQ